MVWNWILEILSFFSLVSVGTATCLRLLKRTPTWQQLAAFALVQTVSTVFFTYIVPVVELQFSLISIMFIINFMWVFEERFFPVTVFCYLTPIAFALLGDFILSPLVFRYLPHLIGHKPLFGVFNRPAHLPIIILAFFLLAKDANKAIAKKLPFPKQLGQSGWYALAAISVALILIPFKPGISLDTGSWTPNSMSSQDIVLSAFMIVTPLLGLTVYRYMDEERMSRKAVQHYLKRHADQEAIVRTLREERHDFLNELTLISNYIELDKKEEALSCVAYSAARFSDRYNYTTLPRDAWRTVLELKRVAAERMQIDFQVDLQTDLPASFAEQRLLPKLIMNLVDNAFFAVRDNPNPQVKLCWSVQSANRILTVSNNGPMITRLQGKTIFQAGVTTKNDASGNHGWGLVICKGIAEELGGTLHYESSAEETSFILTLPLPKEDERLAI